MVTAFVLLNVTLGKEAEVITRLEETEGVKEAYQVYGVYDIIAKVEAENKERLTDVILTRLRKLENVKSTLTMVALE